MTDSIPSIIPDWLASLLALYCLTGTALLTAAVVFGWYELTKKAWRWLRRPCGWAAK